MATYKKKKRVDVLLLVADCIVYVIPNFTFISTLFT